MASLRKKPDVVVASVDPVQPVDVGIDSNPPPAPAHQPADDAEQALRRQLEALQHSESLNRQQQAIVSAEGRRREWLQSNPIAKKFYDRLGAFHNEALQAGLVDTSPDYFQHMESRLAALHSQQPATAGANLIDEMRHDQRRRPRPDRSDQHRERAREPGGSYWWPAPQWESHIDGD